MTRRRILAYGSVVSLAVTLMAASSTPLSSSLDLRLYDTMLRSAGAGPPSGRVAIVEIDDRSLSEIGQWPWPRSVVAQLVDRIHRSGATAVALDILLAERDRFDRGASSPREPGTDAALEDALSAARAVVGYALTFAPGAGDGSGCVLHPLDVTLVQKGERDPADLLFRATGVTCSLPTLSRAAGLSGFVNAGPDRDGVLRRIPALMSLRGEVYPSLALASVRRAERTRHLALSSLGSGRARLTMDGRAVPLDERGTMLIRFRGKRGVFPHVSAGDLLAGRVAPDALRNRIVFVGATALGTGDVVATPFDTAMPGIEVHASAADTLLQGDFIVTPTYTRTYELLGTLFLGLAAAALVAVLGSVLGGTLSAVLLAGLWLAAWIGVASAGIFLSPLFPTLSVGATLAALTLARVRHERLRAESERGRRERAHRFAVHSLTSLVETRDGATGRHARRTEHYSRLLATELAPRPRFRVILTPEYVDLISRLAPLHDIGKVGIRDAVLYKPGPLSPEESGEMRRHPEFGHDAILAAERLAGASGEADDALLRVAKDIVYTHHERWDGKGYPRGLAGEEIPIGGRIMAVVDVYDAVLESRPYRSGGTHDEAVAVIRAGSGTHFDPDVVDAFLRVEGEFRRLSDQLREEVSGQPLT